MISIPPKYTARQVNHLIQGVLLLILLEFPIHVAGTDISGSSFHTIDIEYPGIITPGITWQKCLAGPITNLSYLLQQTSDGGYIMAGRSDSSGTEADLNFWMLKLSPDGDIVWQQSLRGTQQKTILSEQQTDTCGDMGNGRPVQNGSETQEMHNFRIIRFTNEGEISWEKSISSVFPEEVHSIRQTAEGGYIMGGSVVVPGNNGSTSRGDRDYWITKLTPSGEISWEKTFGGTKDDLGYSIRQTADGGYIVAGASASDDGDVTGNHGDLDYWIVKLSPAADIVWEKSYGGSNRDQPYCIQQLADGGYILAGGSASNNGDVTGNRGDSDYWIVKLSPGGEISWQKSFGGKGVDEANDIRQTRDGGYIVAGGSASDNGDVTGNHGDSDYWIVKLSTDGNMRWEKSLGGSRYDSGQSILEASDGGYIVAGVSHSDDGDITGKSR